MCTDCKRGRCQRTVLRGSWFAEADMMRPLRNLGEVWSHPSHLLGFKEVSKPFHSHRRALWSMSAGSRTPCDCVLEIDYLGFLVISALRNNSTSWVKRIEIFRFDLHSPRVKFPRPRCWNEVRSILGSCRPSTDEDRRFNYQGFEMKACSSLESLVHTWIWWWLAWSLWVGCSLFTSNCPGGSTAYLQSLQKKGGSVFPPVWEIQFFFDWLQYISTVF